MRFMVGLPRQRGTPRSDRPQYKNSRDGPYPVHMDVPAEDRNKRRGFQDLDSRGAPNMDATREVPKPPLIEKRMGASQGGVL
jgi:hypothetical protein